MNKSEILQAIKTLAENELNSPKVFVPGVSPVYASGAVLFPEDIEELVDAVLQYWYTDWKKCAKFKRALCEVTGKKHCVLTNSGSSASLIVATALLKRTHGKFIITTALGFPTTVYPIYQNGKIPIFIDVDPKTFSPKFEQMYEIFEHGKSDIAGFIFAHTLGFPFGAYQLIEDKFRIDDCCDCLGSKVRILEDELPAGFFADAMTLSFFPAHIITSGEGGAILTDDEELAQEMEKLINWGRDCVCLPGQSNTCGKRFEHEFKNLPEGWDHKYTFTEMGYNLKTTEFQAALGYSQLKHLDDFVSARNRNYWHLRLALTEYEEFLSFVEIPEWSRPSPFGFPIITNKNMPFSANELITFLENAKIHTRRFFGGNLTRQPVFEDLPYIKKDLEGTDYLMENAFWIGCHPQLTKQHLDYVVDVIGDFFKERKLV